MTSKQKDLLEYVASFMSVLFLAFKEQFNVVLSTAWIDVATTFLALIIVGWGIWHNKHLFIDNPEEKT